MYQFIFMCKAVHYSRPEAVLPSAGLALQQRQNLQKQSSSGRWERRVRSPNV